MCGTDRVETENANVPHHDSGPILPNAFAPLPKKLALAKFFLQLGRVDELGSGILNVTRYLPRYAPGAQPLFLNGPIFRTVLPPAVYPLNAVADQLLALLVLPLAESDQQQVRKLTVALALRPYLSEPAQLLPKLVAAWQ